LETVDFAADFRNPAVNDADIRLVTRASGPIDYNSVFDQQIVSHIVLHQIGHRL